LIDPSGSVEIGVRDNHLVIERGNETTTVELLRGEFPAYGHIFKKDNGRPVRISNRRIRGILERILELAPDQKRAVVLSFGKETLTVGYLNPDVDIAVENIGTDYSGNPLDVVLDGRFLLDALKAVDEETVVMTVTNAVNPCLIEGENDKAFLCAVMPMEL